jgi:diguanylate cyclase (GGDEF)-like protein
VFGRAARDCWNEPVDYAAQVQYFAKRSMSEAIKILIGVGTGLDIVIALAIHRAGLDSDGLASHAGVAFFVVASMFWVIVWCFRPWPSRTLSLAFVVSSDIGIAVMALQNPTWLIGLFGFSAFALISVYLLFFDGPKALALHVVWVLVSTALFAVQVGNGMPYDGYVFAAYTLAAVCPVVAAPLGIQFGIWSLRNDANESVTDPLTGLLNRRGLHLHFGDLLRAQPTRARHLAVMVVDLDRFKEVNDSFGHAIGDDVLIRCARRIRSAVRSRALVARMGGEEFVIIDVTEPGKTQQITERVRHAIAAPADRAPVTASIGVTHIALANFVAPGIDPVALLDTIISSADHAMLDAKRHGGNTTIHKSPADLDI